MTTRQLAIEFRRIVRTPEWFLWCSVAMVLALVAYAVTSLFERPYAGTLTGRIFGIAATTLMVGAALYGVRRRLPRPNLGGASTWVRFHVYGGTVFLLLVLLHTGFRAPQAPLNWWLLILSIWITVGGIGGVIMQKWIPRVLASGISIEVVYERIPELVDELRGKAEGIIEKCPEIVVQYYRQRVSQHLEAPEFRVVYFFDITGGITARMRRFNYMRRFLSDDDRQKLGELQSLYRTKLELDAHYTLQRALRVWLWAHIPVAVVLLALVAIHVFVVIYY